MLNHFTKISQPKRQPRYQSNAKPKKMKLPIIHEILPPEILEKIFKLLYYKELCQAQLICRKWKEIIDYGNLSKKALGNIHP